MEIKIWYGLYYIDDKGFLEKAKTNKEYWGRHITGDTEEEVIQKIEQYELLWTNYVILKHVAASIF